MRLAIFLGNNPDWLFPDFLILPLLVTWGLRLSVAGQPLFWLHALPSKAANKNPSTAPFLNICCCILNHERLAFARGMVADRAGQF